MPTLTEIAQSILDSARALDEYTAAQGLPPTSFTQHTLPTLSGEIETVRKNLVDSTTELKALVQGPIGQLYDVLFEFTDLMSIRFIYRHNVPHHVPLEGDISIADLAEKTKLDPIRLRRYLHHTMMYRVFVESRPGFVAHSSASRLLKTNPAALDTVGFLVEELAPAGTKVIEAEARWPDSAEPNETGYNVEFDTTDSFYREIAKESERARRFGAAMRFMTSGTFYDIAHLIRGYDWKALDVPGSVIVDVGGGQGGVSQALAGATTHTRFVVQDLEGTVLEGQRVCPQHLLERISFQAHDFFTAQPVKHADVYFFRYILHNWADKYSVQILRNLIPALKAGSRVIIYEFLLPDDSQPEWTKKQWRNLDMIQMLGWNSLERTESDWKSLFAAVDPRLEFVGTITPEGSIVSLIEAVWRP
ncbi:S-adenosyl-L-methionine-dependent methyltransferase [Aspergillus pseudoustus]|uniref:S-adenosyl-L-methionine-dependent methyltransferase n=1 Tax=Aspergillus pseudoustus TaxID=1810923 RepID=A0ABR4JZE8_9EURO